MKWIFSVQIFVRFKIIWMSDGTLWEVHTAL